MNLQKISLIIALLLFVTYAWIGRYEMVAVPAGGEGSQGYAYRLDRWTGEVKFFRGPQYKETFPGKN